MQQLCLYLEALKKYLHCPLCDARLLSKPQNEITRMDHLRMHLQANHDVFDILSYIMLNPRYQQVD